MSRTDPAHSGLARRISASQLCENLVRLAGVEPATLGLEGRCSILLSYRRVR
jgi:hypothetical protein